jgi:hypothetical protein
MITDQVYVSIIVSSHNVQKSDNIVVIVEFLKKHNLAEGSLRISGILKCIKALLQRHNRMGFLVNRFPNDTVGSSAQLLDYLILPENVTINILSHRGRHLRYSS